tara:strand:- start:679 stop:1380 length:702 start_codon:yes stop_codon:yes gene_type:complete
MKNIIKTSFIIITVVFFPLKSFSHVEHYKNVEKFIMEIFKDGKKIGFNNYTFSRSGRNLLIDNETEFTISIFGLNAFSIKGSSKETYKNNKLISFKSDSIQNKKVKFVNLYLDKNKENYFIKGSSYTGKADLDIVIGSWWNHKIIQSEKSISPISGSMSKQTINFVKKEKINLYGQDFDTKHFVIISKKLNKDDVKERRYDVWLDTTTNHILKMNYSKYGLWEYKLKQVIYSK